jgi:hypothetical protein
VFLIGRSLGGAVAIHLLAKLSQNNQSIFAGAIIENTFTSIPDMADSMFPFLKLLGPIKNKMIKINWDSLSKVRKVNCPLLFISGDKDTFVPTEMTQRLYAAS